MKMNEKQKAVLAYGRAIQRRKQAAQRGYKGTSERAILTWHVKRTATSDCWLGVNLTSTKDVLILPGFIVIVLLVSVMLMYAVHYYKTLYFWGG